MIHSINRKNKGGNIVLKVDMATAYDRVDWNFLIQVMKGIGFSTKACNLISKCVETPWYSITKNGTYKGLLKLKWRLLQGCPFSPYLSILMEEILTLLLKKALEKGRIGNLFHLRGSPLMSHLFYVVDLLVFSIDEKRFIRIILNSLEVYGSCLGKAINEEKSALFLSKKISNACQRSLLHVTGFVEGNFSTKYG